MNRPTTLDPSVTTRPARPRRGGPGRRWPARLALLAVAAGGCSDDPAVSSHDAPAARNLLLISIDTLRADHLGFLGGERGISPRLDEFAGGAVVFEQAQSSSSWTLPAVASLLTSTYPSTHQVEGYQSRLDESFVTLPEILKEKGFATAGVTSHIFVSSKFGMSQGIDAFDDELVKDGRQAEAVITSPDVTDRGVRWLKQRQGVDGRWFLWLHYFDPHFKYQTHDGISERLGRRDVDLYDGEIEFTDRHVGRLLDELQALGLADDTAVVLVSDHGEEFREHAKLRHGFTLFQEVARVPLVIRAPGVAPRRIATPVRIVDALPTALELLGLPRPPASEGVSLVRAMAGEPLEPLPALGELRLHDEYRADSVRVGRWKLVRDLDNRSMVGYAAEEGGPPVADSTSPIAPAVPPGPRDLLFDLEADPGEQRDVAAEHPEVLKNLQRTLEKLQDRARKLRESGGYQTSDLLQLSEEELEQLRALGYI